MVLTLDVDVIHGKFVLKNLCKNRKIFELREYAVVYVIRG